MSNLLIRSSNSDLVLELFDHKEDYFKVRLDALHINAVREVYAYTDADGFSNLIEDLASQEKPWKGIKSWESLEGEFKFSAQCNSLGNIKFKVILSHYGISEEWTVETEIDYEFGQLEALAKAARNF